MKSLAEQMTKFAERADLAEHGAEEQDAQAPGQALAHAAKAVLLQHAHDYRACADARKHYAPL